jgi:ribosomal-protein-alanine N-acetyltransferase
MRPAAAADAPALAALHAAAFPPAERWGADAIGLMLALPGAFGLLREDGFVLARVAADEAEILTIAVRRASRGRGHGRHLMEETMRRLYRDHVAACFLEVDRGNEPAIGLYRALGFEDVGVRKGYYRAGVDPEGSALVMRLQLR